MEKVDFGFGVTLEEENGVVTLKNDNTEVQRWKMRI